MPEMTIEQAVQIGIEHHMAGRLQDAESVYRQVLAVVPNQPDALAMLGAIASQVGQHQVAAQLMSRALATQPNAPEYQSNYGLVLSYLGDYDNAIAHLLKSVELAPEYAIGWYNLGNVYRSMGKYQQAIDAYQKSIALNPNSAWSHNNLGHALLEMGKFAESIGPFEEAIRQNPGNPDFHINLSTALWGIGRTDESLEVCRHAVRLKPDAPESYSNLGVSLKDQGYTTEATEAFRKAVELAPGVGVYRSNLLYMLHFDPAYDQHALLREHQLWDTHHAGPLRSRIRPHENNRDSERRLRIGYLSPDFRHHPVGRFIVPLLKNHDRSTCQVYCYSSNATVDAVTEQCRDSADQWRVIFDKNDDRAVEMIRADQIDILVDLAAHGASNRLTIFALKPAPVQVTYLAYPSTTGLQAMDYRISDPYLDPPGDSESYYSEKTFRLPETYWCYAPAVAAPPINPLPALTKGQITFGCLNTFRKISLDAQRTWARLLKRVPGSTLLLHAKEGAHRQRLRDLLVAEDVDPDRITFVGHVPIAEYFQLYHQIDIGLDPFPYTGGTTTCDALYMGVPVVTLAGDRAVFRGGLSLLSNIQLDDLVAKDPDQYVAIAATLAGDLERLSSLRSALRDRMQHSPLMDAPRFARNMEQAFRQMWRTWCVSQTPR